MFKPYMGKGCGVPKIACAIVSPGSVRALLAQMAVCEVMGVSLVALSAAGRGDRESAFARQTAIYLCRLVFAMTLNEIAQCFGRDRTTVAHAVRRIEEAREDAGFDATLRRLEVSLRRLANTQAGSRS